MVSKKFNVIALANTFAIIDILLHLLFRIWILLSPRSYEFMMKFFVAGWEVNVQTGFYLNLVNILLSAITEAAVFWLLGASVALLYNKLSK